MHSRIVRLALTIVLCLVGASASAQDRAYVTDSFANRLLVLDAATGATIDSFDVCNEPLDVAVTLDRRKAYIPCRLGYVIAIVNFDTGQVTSVFSGERPYQVAMSPDGARAYVTNSFSGTMTVFDTATDQQIAVVTIDRQPYFLTSHVEVSPDSSQIYVTTWGLTPTVAIVDADTFAVVTLAAEAAPTGIAFSPNGDKAYVVNGDSGGLQVIDTASRTQIGRFLIRPHASGIAVSEDGSKAFITHSNTAREMTVVDLGTGQIRAVYITGGIYPYDVELNLSGDLAWVRSQGVVDVVNTSTYTQVLRVGANGNGGVSAPYSLDGEPPLISCDDPDSGWHAIDVVVACTASDAGTGLANPADAEFTLQTAVLAGVETTSASTQDRTVSDVAGNGATVGPLVFKVDRRAPTISIASPSAGPVVLNSTISASYECQDEGSGVAECHGTVTSGTPVPTGAVGTQTFAVTATDAVGNGRTESSTYTVSFGLCLLYDDTKAHKAGSTIPIKLRLCDAAGMNVSTASTVLHASSLRRIGSETAAGVEDSGAANPDANFRYDAGLAGYIFNLSTTGLSDGVYELSVSASGDLVGHVVRFRVGK
jgi:YVTN family beta-propeller protein